MKIIIIILIIPLLFFSCKQERFKGFSEKSPFAYYQRVTLGEGISYNPDSSFINYKVQFGVFDSINPVVFNKTKEIKFAQTRFNDPESDIFYGLKKGDQLNLILLNNSELFEKLTFETDTLSQNWFVNIIIDKVIDTNPDRENLSDPNLIEYNRIRTFLTFGDNNINFKFIEGIWLERIFINSSNFSPKYEEVILDYKGYYLDGNIFDNPDYPLKFLRTDQNQVIPGIMIALNYMRIGDSTMVIIPSHLAFGEMGSKDGNVPPNEPVVYGLKLLRQGEYVYPEND